MSNYFSTVADINLTDEIFTSFPPGWKSVSDISEGFLLAMALEIEARQRIDYRNPWGSEVIGQLPKKYQYDTFGTLIVRGPILPSFRDSGALWNADKILMARHGEQIGRLVLIDLIWRLASKIYDDTAHFEARSGVDGYFAAVGTFSGMLLHHPAAVIFDATFRTLWLERSTPRPLSHAEKILLAGEVDGASSWYGGEVYINSIWKVAIELVERFGTKHFIHIYDEKLDTVEYIISKRADDEAKGSIYREKYIWSGWPHEAKLFDSGH